MTLDALLDDFILNLFEFWSDTINYGMKWKEISHFFLVEFSDLAIKLK